MVSVFHIICKQTVGFGLCGLSNIVLCPLKLHVMTIWNVSFNMRNHFLCSTL
jgi:hypothetical protein